MIYPALSDTCIDHIYTNTAELCSKAISRTVGFSDHNVIAMVRITKVPKARPRILLQRSYKSFSEIAFIKDIKNVKWDDVLNSKDVNMALQYFSSLLFPIIDRHAPLKKFSVRSTFSPWLDNDIKTLLMKRDDLKRTAVRSGDPSDWIKYRAVRNMVTKHNRQKKKNYYQNKINGIKNDSKKLWNTFKSILGKGHNKPSFIESDGKFITKPQEIANYFNDYFSDKIDKIRKTMMTIAVDQSDNLIRDSILKEKKCNFSFQPVAREEVNRMLLLVKNDKQSGLDNLESKLVLIIADYITAPVSHIFNLSLQEGVFPQEWKTAKIIPIAKDSRSSFCGTNSRPISILPVLSKILEKIAFKQIQNYFCTNQLDSEFQHAYKKNHSTCTALVQMTDDWLRQIDDKNIVGAVLLDFSAAFDVIDHELLLGKLFTYGFGNNAIKWVRSYLSDRSQCVFFNGALSGLKSVVCGLPQGSCLGPLLFSVFTNDLPLALNKASHLHVRG